ncbi:MAG: extracellular solute-binding protein [Patescibacteria group bacterium]
MGNLSRRQLLIIGGIAGAALVLLLIIFVGLKPSKSGAAKLIIWGTFENPELFSDLIKPFTQQTKAEITYVPKDPKTYEQELINALAAGAGPDIFFFENTWLLKHYNKIQPAPKSLFTVSAVEQSYPQVVVRDFTSADNVYAIPLFLDSLALFYNQDLLDQAAIPFPPKTLEELVEMAPKLTKFNERRDILYSGFALGSAANVSHATDILSLLMLQAGSNIISNDFTITLHQTNAGAQALNFYTQFAKSKNQVYSWDEKMGNSIEEFARGKAAIAIGYASDIPIIRSISPYFNFKIALMPQPETSQLRKDYASYYGLAVNKQSRYKQAAWELISFLSQNETAESFARKVNLPPAKRILLDRFKNQPIMDIFSRQAYTALSWPQADPIIIDQIFKSAISQSLAETQPLDMIISSVANQLDKLYKQL